MTRSIAAILAVSLTAAVAATAWGQGAAQPLVKFQIKDGGIPASLTGHAGDAQKGRAAMVDQKLGNCLACHAVSALKDQPYHGNVGPSLDGVASRLSEAQIRLHIVDPTKLSAQTIMPPFYRIDGLNRVLHQFQGKPILTAEQVEDVVAFLETLK